VYNETFFNTRVQVFKEILRVMYLLQVHFQAHNYLGLSLQVLSHTVLEFLVLELGMFVQKFGLWMKYVESKCYGMLKFLTSLENELSDKFSCEVICHLSLHDTESLHYFIKDVTCCAYVHLQSILC